MRIALIGATGYGGTEAMRLLHGRTDVELAWLGSDRLSGTAVSTALPQFRGSRFSDLPFSPLSEMNELTGLDAVLLALPHGEARKLAPQLLAQGLRVIDFSGDFRLPEVVYQAWYGQKSDAIADRSVHDEVAAHAVYGLPELYREQIATARLVANPGCYATCAELALLPLIEQDLVDGTRLLIDAKSGVSGAGKAPSQSTHFVEVQESMRAYKVGAHQHTPEIEQVLTDARRRRRTVNRQEDVRVLLTTQLLPIKRGIYVTAYAPLTASLSAVELHARFVERYLDEPFVQVLPLGQAPEIRHVVGTNKCQIGVHLDERTQTALIMAVIDNLGKGAAGQALQNLNRMFGCPETLGLTELPWM